LDIHKKTISYCVKDAAGEVLAEGTISATRQSLDEWVRTLRKPWTVAMEATMFTGWIYDHLLPHAAAVKVAHPLMLRAIAASKKKNDRIDASKIADCLRCVRRGLQQAKAPQGGLLQGADDDQPGHQRRSPALLTICRETIVRIGKTESARVRSLARDPLLRARVERLMTIPAAAPITALTWVLEVDDVARFGSVKQAISYCGLCGAKRSSAETIKRMPISKQRNKHLQSVLIEAAKLGPRLSPDLALVYDTEKQKGHANRATLAVARKLLAYLLAVDRSGREFVVAGERRAAA
jgi:transposase